VLSWHVTVVFRRWRAPPSAPKPDWAETYGKTQVESDSGVRSVAEIELTHRLREAGWQAGWVDTFGSAPRAWREWLIEPSTLPAPLRDGMKRIADRLATARAGRPDLVAWCGKDARRGGLRRVQGPARSYPHRTGRMVLRGAGNWDLPRPVRGRALAPGAGGQMNRPSFPTLAPWLRAHCHLSR
jgi:hypothetical protein